MSIQNLTVRQIEIVKEASKGSSIKKTAADLGISPKTVQVLRGKVIKKLACANITDAAIQLQAAGII
jgi:DNA-binding CsgD family transcriptional regulator